MKLTAHPKEGRGWPNYILWGRVRTSTAALFIAFIGIWWLYETYQPAPAPAPATQIVPPGFIPDPSYTWVPRTDVQRGTTTTTTTAMARIAITPTPTTMTITKHLTLTTYTYPDGKLEQYLIAPAE